MDVERGIVIVSFGDRQDYVNDLVRNLRVHTDLPVLLITDVNDIGGVDVRRKLIPTSSLGLDSHPRAGVRNCNIYSAIAALTTFESTLVLNDDMRVVSTSFLDGFRMAERFGVCVPTNPRIYLKYNAMGADTTGHEVKEEPLHMPACNVSPLFVCRKIPAACRLIEQYKIELETCMRGTVAFSKASWKTGVTPVYLPEQWCVGASNAQYIKNYTKKLKGKDWRIEPIMLHYGQAEVRNVFPGY